ncbi:hypothetical protein Taro_028378 [Colocasia esculenta]|uniref:Uncharacterized protein n=1 Tax=Colocasia esculenta TaxID=4460 RepID=A0A843VGC1_COLES|nr:hypothetical protein [Colocasia esculenta]
MTRFPYEVSLLSSLWDEVSLRGVLLKVHRLDLERRSHLLHPPSHLSLHRRTRRAAPSCCCRYLLLLVAVWHCTTWRNGTTGEGGVIVIADHPLCGYH